MKKAWIRPTNIGEHFSWCLHWQFCSPVKKWTSLVTLKTERYHDVTSLNTNDSYWPLMFFSLVLYSTVYLNIFILSDHLNNPLVCMHVIICLISTHKTFILNHSTIYKVVTHWEHEWNIYSSLLSHILPCASVNEPVDCNAYRIQKIMLKKLNADGERQIFMFIMRSIKRDFAFLF